VEYVYNERQRNWKDIHVLLKSSRSLPVVLGCANPRLTVRVELHFRSSNPDWSELGFWCWTKSVVAVIGITSMYTDHLGPSISFLGPTSLIVLNCAHSRKLVGYLSLRREKIDWCSGAQTKAAVAFTSEFLQPSFSISQLAIETKERWGALVATDFWIFWEEHAECWRQTNS